MKVVVGSKNPVKIAAVENAVKRFWNDAEVIGIEVSHGTSIQPNSTEEAIKGATKRAELAIKEANADLGFGLEGNTFDSEHGMFVDGWVVAIDKNGKKGIANCGCLLLPPQISTAVRNGMELGPAADAFFKTQNIKQKEGVVGALTGGKVTRTTALEQGVVFAIVRFLHPHYYE
jgi:inosine/xanthosine triphosphatase